MQVAIVDLGMGNLFSVRQACAQVGLEAEITADPEIVRRARAIVLPGVGAFQHAVETIRQQGLADALSEAVEREAPLVGICLGMQVLMEESHEFGHHNGLGLIPGSVVRLEPPDDHEGRFVVPHIGWNSIQKPKGNRDAWTGTLLEGLPDGTTMYFLHSYHVRLRDEGMTVATTEYEGVDICAAVQSGRIFGIQCHPERSGPLGLSVYANLASLVDG